MSTRYTSKNLQAELDLFNDWMKGDGLDAVFIWGHRNGYNAVDFATSANKHGSIERTVATGTPRECIGEARRFMQSLYRERDRKELAQLKAELAQLRAA